MSYVLESQRRGAPTPLAIHAYFDSVALWLDRKLKNTEVQELKRLCGHCHSVQSRPRWSNNYSYRLHLHQPTQEALWFLDGIVKSQDIDYFVNWVDLALDFTFYDEAEARSLYRFFDRHLIKRWHGRRKLQYEGTTRYTSDWRWVRNQFVLYADKPSRMTDDPCVHLEWRTRTKGAVKVHGLDDLQKLCAIDHRAFWKSRLILKEIDFQMLGRQRRGAGRNKKPHLISYRQLGPIDADVRTGHLLARLAVYSIYEREIGRYEESYMSYRESMKKFKKGLIPQKPTPPIMPDVPSYPTAQAVYDCYKTKAWFRPNTSLRHVDATAFLPKKQQRPQSMIMSQHSVFPP